MGIIIDGTNISSEIKKRLTNEIKNIQKTHGIVPGLVTLLIGDDPGSKFILNSNIRLAKKLGYFLNKLFYLPSLMKKKLSQK